MTTYVLIHGSFRGGWYWKYVRESLEAAGHRVYAPSLTGMGEHSHLVSRGDDEPPLRVSRETWVADVVKLLEFEDLRDVILVGHSLGGVIITEASGRCSERIACLAFVDAPILSPGEAPVFSAAAPTSSPGPAVLVSDRQTGSNAPADLLIRPASAPVAPAVDPWRWNSPLPVNETEITDPTIVAWMRERLTPNPSGPGRGPIPELPAEALALPRRILFCTQTAAGYPPALSRRVLDERGTPYDLIDAGHDAPVSAPALVSGWLMNIPTP
jgi:pimeloyl-ACP methyl ester carboxylesterase